MHRADSQGITELKSWYRTYYVLSVLPAMGNTTQSYTTHHHTKVHTQVIEREIDRQEKQMNSR